MADLKVWCVFRDYDYEGDSLYGLFSTEEYAREWIEAQDRPNKFFVRDEVVDDLRRSAKGKDHGA